MATDGIRKMGIGRVEMFSEEADSSSGDLEFDRLKNATVPARLKAANK